MRSDHNCYSTWQQKKPYLSPSNCYFRPPLMRHEPRFPGFPKGLVTMKASILEKALTLVPKYGWTRLSIEQACTELNLPATCHGLFPRGEIDLISFFVETSNEGLSDRVVVSEEMPMRDRLKAVARQRLECVLPHHSTWSQALQTLALPYNVLIGAQLLHQTSDEILHLCGDQSTDLSWYTKRASLGAVYAASELHLLTDMSPTKEETWNFLERRLDDYAGLMQTCSQFSKLNLIKS